MKTETKAVDPLLRFEEEHRHALRELDILEHAIDGLESGKHAEPLLEAVADVHTFLNTAVKRHNENEEVALFPHLGDDAPTALFIEEHATLRGFERQLGDALRADDPADAVCEPAREIVSLLRAHIQREDEVLFPMARGLLGPEGLALVSRGLKG